MADVNNKIDVRGDGSVVLYQRMNRDGSVNNIFQMRIRIPLSASKGYFRGSTALMDDMERVRNLVSQLHEEYS